MLTFTVSGTPRSQSARVLFNAQVRDTFLASAARERASGYKNESEVIAIQYLNALTRPAVVGDVATMFKKSGGTYGQEMKACIEMEQARDRLCKKRKRRECTSPSPESFAFGTREVNEGQAMERSTSRKASIDWLTESYFFDTSVPEALRCPSEVGELQVDWRDLYGSLSIANHPPICNIEHALVQVRRHFDFLSGHSKVECANGLKASLLAIVKYASANAQQSLPEDTPLLRDAYRRWKHLCVHADVYKTQDPACLFWLYALPEPYACCLISATLGTKAMEVAESAAAGKLTSRDFIVNLERATRTDNRDIVYVHAGFPKAVDGPNTIDPKTLLVYVGSATGQCDSGGALKGGARRIYSKASGHANQQNRRTRAHSQHWDDFYGKPSGRNWTPKVVVDDKEVEDEDPFYIFAYFVDQSPHALHLIMEAITVILLKTCDVNPLKQIDPQVRTTKWRGCNRELPTRGRFLSSETQAARANLSNTSQYNEKVDTLIAGTHSSPFALQESNKGRFFQIPALNEGKHYLTICAATWKRRSDLPQFTSWSSNNIGKSTSKTSREAYKANDTRTYGTLQFSVQSIRRREWTMVWKTLDGKLIDELTYKDVHHAGSLLTPGGMDALMGLGARICTVLEGRGLTSDTFDASDLLLAS